MTRSRTFCALLCLGLASPLQAADIYIGALRDIEFGDVAPTAGRIAASIDLCVALSDRVRYSVTARGDGPADAFVLSNGVAYLPVDVFFADRTGRRGTRLQPGVPQGNLHGSRQLPRRACSRPNASVAVSVAAADLAAASAGQYRGTIALTVAPE